MQLTPEAEFHLHCMAREADALNADELRQVLGAVYRLWFSERQMIRSALESEGIAMVTETRGATPKELAAALARSH